MNIKSLKNHKCLITAVFVLLVFYIWLASRIPYTHDDWEWGINQGMVHLLTADKDSRFCGNLIEVIITRNEFIKTVFMGIVFTLVPLSVTILSGYIFDIKKFSNTDLVRTSIFGFANFSGSASELKSESSRRSSRRDLPAATITSLEPWLSEVPE